MSKQQPEFLAHIAYLVNHLRKNRIPWCICSCMAYLESDAEMNTHLLKILALLGINLTSCEELTNISTTLPREKCPVQKKKMPAI
jgi:hypothetical protein